MKLGCMPGTIIDGRQVLSGLTGRRCTLKSDTILGRAPDSFAAPAWRVTPAALRALEEFPFRYESDCRGHSLFYPLLDGRRLDHVQVPATLPTYDELIGLRCTNDTYNDYMLDLIRPDGLNVLTIHAEAEGIGCRAMFEDFLAAAKRRDIFFVPLGDLLSGAGTIASAEILRKEVPGREGWISIQGEADRTAQNNREASVP